MILSRKSENLVVYILESYFLVIANFFSFWFGVPFGLARIYGVFFFADYFCKLKIIDDSRPKCGFPVHLFDQHPNALPRVVSVGDVILLSRVMVYSDIQSVLLPFSFCVIL